MNCTIRTMRREDVETAIELAAAEGWNPGLHDASCFHAADPGGFLLAESDGRTIGCISAVSYSDHYGFIGLYIVVPAWRGKGVGSRLWAAAMDRLAGRVVGLDGVPAQQAYYSRKGFALAWQNARFACVAKARERGDPAPIVPLAEVDRGVVVADDRRVFPAAREAFLGCWIAMPEATGLAWVEGGRLLGWGLIRRCRSGYKIAPLLADRPDVAIALYDALASWAPPGDTVYLDVPMPNREAIALTRARGLEIVFQTARMYAGPAPAIEVGRIYGVTSFELG